MQQIISPFEREAVLPRIIKIFTEEERELNAHDIRARIHKAGIDLTTERIDWLMCILQSSGMFKININEHRITYGIVDAARHTLSKMTAPLVH